MYRDCVHGFLIVCSIHHRYTLSVIVRVIQQIERTAIVSVVYSGAWAAKRTRHSDICSWAK